MILQLSALTKQQEVRQFMCSLPTLEAGFELLTTIAGAGDTLLRASLIDAGQQIHLPIEAFDGASFLAPLGQLEQDWRAILREQPQPPLLIDRQRAHYYKEQLHAYESYIIRLEMLISHLSYKHQRAQRRQPLGHEQLMTCLHSLLGRYQLQLDRIHQVRQRLLTYTYRASIPMRANPL